MAARSRFGPANWRWQYTHFCPGPNRLSSRHQLSRSPGWQTVQNGVPIESSLDWPRIGLTLPAVADYSKLTDGELFEQLRTEAEKLPFDDPEERRELWREIDGISAEIRRRYPPSSTPISS